MPIGRVMTETLIISDSRAGHEAQSRAFCELKGLKYDICRVKYRFKILKLLSYILDFLGVYLPIFSGDGVSKKHYTIVISAGSTTYYPLKYFAKKLKAKSIALMRPKGYKNSFDLIFIQSHDAPKKLPKNAILLPINICLPSQNSFYTPQKPAIAFIIGGNNRHFDFDSELIISQMRAIFTQFSDYEKLITTSPRTPASLESRLKSEFGWDFGVWFSEDKRNPIADFIGKCEAVFITSDSTSMISEAASSGTASVSIIGTIPPSNSKIGRFLDNLKSQNYISFFTNSVATKTDKYDLKSILNGIDI